MDNLILSKKQLELLELLNKGLTPKQIAAELKLSLQKIQNYLKDIVRKTKAANNTESRSHELAFEILEFIEHDDHRHIDSLKRESAFN